MLPEWIGTEKPEKERLKYHWLRANKPFYPSTLPSIYLIINASLSLLSLPVIPTLLPTLQ